MSDTAPQMSATFIDNLDGKEAVLDLTEAQSHTLVNRLPHAPLLFAIRDIIQQGVDEGRIKNVTLNGTAAGALLEGEIVLPADGDADWLLTATAVVCLMVARRGELSAEGTSMAWHRSAHGYIDRFRFQFSILEGTP